MANPIHDDSKRDVRQRSLGCVGASMMAHVGLITLLALAPEVKSLDPSGLPEGSIAGLTMVDLQSAPASAPAAETVVAEAAPGDSVPQEVLLAANTDATAVELPSEPPKAPPAPRPVAVKKVIAKARQPKVADKPLLERIEELPAPIEVTDVAPAEPETEAPVEAVPAAEEAEAANEEPSEAPPVAVATVEEAPAPNAEPVAEAEPQEEAKPEAVAQTSPAAAPAQAAPVAAAPVAAAAQAASSGSTQGAAPAATTGTASARTGGTVAGVPQAMKIRDWTELVARPGNPNGTYPQRDRLLGRQGIAVVIGRVTRDGSIATVQLERSSGSATLDQEALKTFAKWKFVPGQEGMVRKPFQFRLTGEAQMMPAKLGR